MVLHLTLVFLFLCDWNACKNNSNRKDFSGGTVNGISGLRRSEKVLFLEYYFFSYLDLLIIRDHSVLALVSWFYMLERLRCEDIGNKWGHPLVLRDVEQLFKLLEMLIGSKPLFFIYLFFWPCHCMWDLSSLTRDGTRAPCSGRAES